MEDANPNANKRPRADAPACGSGSGPSLFGKGVMEQMSRFAAPILTQVKESLFARAITLRAGAKKSAKAAETLEAHNQEGKIVRSLEFNLTDEQKRLLPKLPEALRDQLRRLSQAMQVEALTERRDEALLREQELAAIVTGRAFTAEAIGKLAPDDFGAHPTAVAALREIIAVEQEAFHLDILIKLKRLEASEATRDARRTAQAERTERTRMDVEQQETSVTLKRFVAEELRKGKAALIKEIKASLAASPTKAVRFTRGGGRKPGAGPSRGPSRGRSAGRSESRSREPRPRGRRGRTPSAPPSTGRGNRPRPGRPRSAPRHERSTSRGRSWSRGNSSGGRGHTSRRPPSAKRDGSARVGGGGGSETGPRR